MAQSRIPAGSHRQRATSSDVVYRVQTSIIESVGGFQEGTPLDTGFSEDRSFEDDTKANELAEDIEENPEAYYEELQRAETVPAVSAVVTEQRPGGAGEYR